MQAQDNPMDSVDLNVMYSEPHRHSYAHMHTSTHGEEEVVCEFTLCPVSADNEAVCGDQ